MVRTASTGADVDRTGDVPGPSRLGRSSRQSRNAQMMGKQSSVFVGLLAPTLLIRGLYNTLVKQHGSECTDARA
jgi:hypothetical protein